MATDLAGTAWATAAVMGTAMAAMAVVVDMVHTGDPFSTADTTDSADTVALAGTAMAAMGHTVDTVDTGTADTSVGSLSSTDAAMSRRGVVW